MRARVWLLALGVAFTCLGLGAAAQCPRHAYVYKTQAAPAVTTGADVTFDTDGPLSGGITHGAGAAALVFASGGTFRVSFSVSGSEANQFSLFRNGALIPGTTYGSGAGQQQNSGQAIVTVAAADALTLRNFASATAVTLAPFAGGTQAHVMASLLVEELLGDYAYIYRQAPGATVAINADVTLDTNGAMTGALAHVPGLAAIVVVTAASYKITFSLSGAETSQFALFVNGVAAAGTIYGSGAGTQQTHGAVVLALGAGDVVTLRSFASPAAVTLASFVGGAGANVMASLVLESLTATAPQYASVYTLAPTAAIALGASVAFASNGALVGATHALGSSDVVLTAAGVYEVVFSVSGSEKNQFALFVNGVALAGAVYGSNDATQENTGQALVVAGAGDVLTLRNHASAAAVTLAATIGGTQNTVVAALLAKSICLAPASPTPAYGYYSPYGYYGPYGYGPYAYVPPTPGSPTPPTPASPTPVPPLTGGGAPAWTVVLPLIAFAAFIALLWCCSSSCCRGAAPRFRQAV